MPQDRKVFRSGTAVIAALTAVFALSAQSSGGAARADTPAHRVNVTLAQPSAVTRRIAEVFRRQVEQRCAAAVTIDGPGDVQIEMAVRPSLPREGFTIADGPHGSVRIVGTDARGLLYGVGRFLRSSRFDDGGFTPGTWRGTSAPEKPFRCIYFATHFHNYYHEAPVADIARYVEELGLWGYNAVLVWYDMHHFRGFDDPASLAMVQRLHAILGAAKAIGLDAGLGVLANEGYADSPRELRLTPPTQLAIRGMYGTELCPSKPGARELVLSCFRREFEAFRDIGIDYLSIWPYDQGGCGCEQCRPWGANGFLKMAEPVARLARDAFPRVKVVLSTWLFDARINEGEWEGLTRAFARRPDWVDYILADSHTTYPRYPLDKGVPGGLPLVNFPEISMWGMSPWGGRGANPLPQRFKALWDSVGTKLSGGFPYSEGIFEDMNKAIFSQFYWKRDTPAIDTARQYASYEFSPGVADDVVHAVNILEQNHTLPAADAGSADALDRLQKADARLSRQARASWRWRILLLRALLDREHYAQAGQRTDAAAAALRELTVLYHAQKAEPSVRPPL
jgi:hypothetical protein